jgi:hypothetical protein
MAEFSDEIKTLAVKLEQALDHVVDRKVRNRGPKFVVSDSPSGGDDLATGSNDLKVRYYYDGTNTVIEVVDKEETLLAEGRARRRKGDPRDLETGLFIALSRAFSALSDTYAEVAAERLT